MLTHAQYGHVPETVSLINSTVIIGISTWKGAWYNWAKTKFHSGGPWLGAYDHYSFIRDNHFIYQQILFWWSSFNKDHNWTYSLYYFPSCRAINFKITRGEFPGCIPSKPFVTFSFKNTVKVFFYMWCLQRQWNGKTAWRQESQPSSLNIHLKCTFMWGSDNDGRLLKCTGVDERRKMKQ